MGSNQSVVTKQVAQAYTSAISNAVNSIIDTTKLHCQIIQNINISSGIIPAFKNFPERTCETVIDNSTINANQFSGETCNLDNVCLLYTSPSPRD